MPNTTNTPNTTGATREPQRKATVRKVKADENKTPIINSLVIRPFVRQTLEIDKWRQAIRSADYGWFTLLYNLYEDLKLDTVLNRTISKRIEAITNAELNFQTKDGESIEEIEDLIDTPEFEFMLQEIMQAKFWGISLLEFDFKNGFNCFSIPRKHIRDKIKQVAISESDLTGESYEGDPFFIEIKGEERIGILASVAQYVIYKRGGFGDFSQFVELFGQPFRKGKYSSVNDDSRQMLEEALEKMGSAPWCALPDDTDITYETNKTNADGALYNALRLACNEELLIGIVGQTMTTLDGASRSQGQVHLEVEKNINKADMRFVQRILNKYLVPLLQQRGYPVKDGKFNFAEKAETIPLKDRFAIDQGVAQQVPIAPSYWYKTYDIPKPTPEELAQMQAEKETQAEESIDNPEENADTPQSSGGKEAGKGNKETKSTKPKEDNKDKKLKWFERLFSFFSQAPDMGASRTAPSCCNNLTLTLPDNTFDEEALLKRIASGESKIFDTALFSFVAGTLLDGFQKGWKKKNKGVKLADLGFDYGAHDAGMLSAFELNIFRFSAAKTLAEIQELNQLFRGSKDFDTFAINARVLTGKYNKAWLETEYNTALLTGEAASTYYRLKAQTATFKYWMYKTVGDDRVRPEHEKLDGIILRHDDPRWNRIYPPNGWNCRCYILPLTEKEAEARGFDITANQAAVDKYFDTEEFKKDKTNGFAINRADAGEVFTANQFYIRKFDKQGAAKLNELLCNDWGLKEIRAQQKVTAAQDMPTYKGTAKDWQKEHGDDNGNIHLTDYAGRELFMKAKGFNKHAGISSKKYEDRVKLLGALEDTLKNADEVWINNYVTPKVFDNLIYIRYYKDAIVAVVAKLNTVTAELELQSFFDVVTNFPTSAPGRTRKQARLAKENMRRGLLIKT